MAYQNSSHMGQPPPTYEPGAERIESFHASDLSRPICFRCNIELDLHPTLGEVSRPSLRCFLRLNNGGTALIWSLQPGSSERVCPVIVEAATLPTHYGPHTQSRSGASSSASPAPNACEATPVSTKRNHRAFGERRARAIASQTILDDSMYDILDDTMYDQRLAPGPLRSGSSSRIKDLQQSQSQSSKRSNSGTKSTGHGPAPNMAMTAGDHGEDAIRHGTTLSMQSFLFDEHRRSKNGSNARNKDSF